MVDPASGPEAGSQERPAPPGMPRWVKGLGVVALVVVAVLVVVMLLVGGEHGPGRHAPGADASGVGALSLDEEPRARVFG